ncbi:MAG: hypothetical protein IKV73_02250 [Clostridia bacterium]|nr:hypothetical protein [Clostridia bacterium]
MGIGKIDNYRFYEGYEYETEVELSTNDENMETLHIWDGFFMDIFGEPSLDGNGWHGFTRDYNQCEGAFDDAGEAVITNLQEYIDDLKSYKNRKFDYEETKDVYALICDWLDEAVAKHCEEIFVRVF